MAFLLTAMHNNVSLKSHSLFLVRIKQVNKPSYKVNLLLFFVYLLICSNLDFMQNFLRRQLPSFFSSIVLFMYVYHPFERFVLLDCQSDLHNFPLQRP